MQIKRLALTRLKKMLTRFPAVALIGPRQCGKTTLAISLGGAYFDLEQETDRLRLDLEWESLAQSKKPVILDEAQSHPGVFPRLRSAIDRARKQNGRFLLLGSVSPALMKQVSESLAGRLGLCELTPFLLSEIPGKNLDRLWLHGGFPDGGILKPSLFPEWQENYLQLLAQRDLPAWGLPAKPQVTARFFKMLAAGHGSIWNASDTGRNLGLDYHTVNTYLDTLEGAFLVRKLAPFSGNLKKRLVRRPKLYWRDSGLMHALNLIGNHDALLCSPLVGASWEGFVIGHILDHLHEAGVKADASFFRTSDGHEIDLVLETGKSRWAVEIKLTTSPSDADMRRLNKTADMISADRRILLTRRSGTYTSNNQTLTDLHGMLELIEKV